MPNDATTQLEIQGTIKTAVDKSSLAKSKKEIESTLSSVKVDTGGWGMMKDALKTWGGMALTPMKKMASAIKETTKHFNGFFAAIKRIAIYRAIRSALKAISQGFQEGIQNAYQWAVVTGNQFARSMDMMATSALYLKNSLGAMAMPLVNYLAPILDHLIDQFVELINVVNRFIATITGASSWVKALKYPAQYMEQAAGSAKKLKNQLLGFDDLNVLNASKSGGSASAMDYSNMFQQVQLEASKINFTKSIMDAIKSSDWEKVGELIDEYINTTIENIPAADIAKALGEKLNKAIGLVHTLLKSVSFYQIGVKIGEFISNLQLDWGRIAGSWIRWNTNIVDTLLGLLDGVNWWRVGYSFGEYIKGLLNEFSNWLNGIDWYAKGNDLYWAIIKIIDGVDWKGVITALKDALINAFKASISAAFGFLNNLDWNIHLNQGTIDVNYTPTVTYQQAQSQAQSQGYTIPPGMPPAQAAYLHSIGKLANGGFPEQGTMFIAGESGAEFVGQIGGRTGVYNADQMANSLASANEGVVNTLVSVGNAIVGAINRKDTSINVTDIRRALNTTNMRYGV